MLYEQALARSGEDRQRDVLLAVAVVADPRGRRGLARGRHRHHWLGELRILLDELSVCGIPGELQLVLDQRGDRADRQHLGRLRFLVEVDGSGLCQRDGKEHAAWDAATAAIALDGVRPEEEAAEVGVVDAEAGWDPAPVPRNVQIAAADAAEQLAQVRARDPGVAAVEPLPQLGRPGAKDQHQAASILHETDAARLANR